MTQLRGEGLISRSHITQNPRPRLLCALSSSSSLFSTMPETLALPPASQRETGQRLAKATTMVWEVASDGALISKTNTQPSKS